MKLYLLHWKHHALTVVRFIWMGWSGWSSLCLVEWSCPPWASLQPTKWQSGWRQIQKFTPSSWHSWHFGCFWNLSKSSVTLPEAAFCTWGHILGGMILHFFSNDNDTIFFYVFDFHLLWYLATALPEIWWENLHWFWAKLFRILIFLLFF